MIDALKATYREEANELLQQLEQTLLELEADPQSGELVGLAFRQMHTIKGSGAMFGFERIAKLMHAMESAFDHVRAGRMRVSRELISLALESRDVAHRLLEEAFGGPAVDALEPHLIESLHKLVTAALATPGEAEAAPNAIEETTTAATGPRRYKITFVPEPDVFRRGTNVAGLLRELAALGEMTVEAETSKLPSLEEMDVERCYTGWRIELVTDRGEDAIRDVFLFVEDESELKIEACEEHAAPGATGTAPAPGSTADAPVAAHADDKPQAATQRAAAPSAAIRISSEKLDGLANAVGELVTAQARLSQIAGNNCDADLSFVAEEIERLVERLRSDTMAMRMLPIGATFARYQRLVRDLSVELGKQVELVTEGAETELDKNVIEQLNDPLVHIIRNSIDHGMESPEERERAGKPRTGTVKLSAIHAGAYVLIRISDDGAGLDVDKIRRKAEQSGLIDAGTELSDEQIFSFIFAAGFSTASKVTQVSGRGVGLDVVQRQIQNLRGSVDVKSQRGVGTTFTLRLPLTLAIIDGLLVDVAGEQYILPVSHILECVEWDRRKHRTGVTGHTIVVRDELIPFVDLRDFFAVPGAAPEISQIILTQGETGKVGIAVDRVVGDHHTVIKNLGPLYRQVESFSGATVLGDGRLALILDLEKLVKQAA